MNTFNTVVKFFQDSGMFIYPSILIMALGLAIAIERFVFLQPRAQREPQGVGARCCRCCRTASSRRCRA